MCKVIRPKKGIPNSLIWGETTGEPTMLKWHAITHRQRTKLKFIQFADE